MRLGSSMPRFCVVAGVKIDSLGDRLHCQWPIVDILARKEYPSDPVDTPDQVCDVTKVVRNHVYETPRNVLLPQASSQLSCRYTGVQGVYFAKAAGKGIARKHSTPTWKKAAGPLTTLSVTTPTSYNDDHLLRSPKRSLTFRSSTSSPFSDSRTTSSKDEALNSSRARPRTVPPPIHVPVTRRNLSGAVALRIDTPDPMLTTRRGYTFSSRSTGTRVLLVTSKRNTMLSVAGRPREPNPRELLADVSLPCIRLVLWLCCRIRKESPFISDCISSFL
mmetsp:Transcript_52928/g.133042  ORF Transcript_52928/g.133042 Transcript_52928/m.133042 type:complete len:276 (-) Transcript_52928:7853-8680(-)